MIFSSLHHNSYWEQTSDTDSGKKWNFWHVKSKNVEIAAARMILMSLSFRTNRSHVLEPYKTICLKEFRKVILGSHISTS